MNVRFHLKAIYRFFNEPVPGNSASFILSVAFLENVQRRTENLFPE
jgi:hypothetical protein